MTWTKFLVEHHRTVEIVALVLIGSIISLLEWLIYRRFLPRFIKKEMLWPKVIFETLHYPLQIYIWVIIVSFIFSIIAHFVFENRDFVDGMQLFRRVVTVVFIFWFGMRFIRSIENGIVIRARAGVGKINDEMSVHALAQISRVGLIVIIVLMMLQTIGIKMSALLALGGVGGAIIGFAAKDSLSNFIGGMMIYWDRPFSVGDWIRSPDNPIEGTVENIGWRLTRIRTFEMRPLYVPNGTLSNIAIENATRMTNRRIRMTLSVRYQDLPQLIQITTDIESMLKQHADIDISQPLYVNLSELGASSLNILVNVYTKTIDWSVFYATQQDVLLKIITIVNQHGAECAFPTQTIQIAHHESV